MTDIQNDQIEVVQRLLDEGEFDEAINELADIPESAAVLKLRAAALSYVGRFEEAEECYKSLVRQVPDDPSIHEDMGSFLVNLGRFEEAAEAYQQGIRHDPGNTALYRDLGMALRLHGDSESAMEAYESALKIDDEDSENWAAKSDLLIELGQFPEALECLNKASASSTGDFGTTGWIDRGYSFSTKSASDEALYCYEQALTLDPQNTTALLGKAAALVGQGNNDEAIACYDHVIELQRDDPTAWAEKGGILARQGQLEEALECLDTAVRLNPRDKDSYLMCGYCRIELARYADALLDYKHAIAIDSDYALAWEGKGRCLDELGRSAESVVAYRRALKLNPNSLWGNNNLGWVLADRYKRYEEALVHYDRAIELGPSEATPVINKANSLVALDRVKDARALLEQAAERVRDNEKVSVIEYLASIHSEHLHDCKTALQLFEQSEQLSPGVDLSVLSIAELLIRLDRHQEARERATGVLEKSDDEKSQTIASFLLFTSQALEGNLDDSYERLALFVNRLVRMEVSGDRNALGSWSYKGLANTIREASVDLTAKFLLLVAIDLQTGRLSSPTLEKLSEFEKLVQPAVSPKPAALPEEEKGPVKKMVNWLWERLAAAG